jgi:hypothetical protein
MVGLYKVGGAHIQKVPVDGFLWWFWKMGVKFSSSIGAPRGNSGLAIANVGHIRDSMLALYS